MQEKSRADLLFDVLQQHAPLVPIEISSQVILLALCDADEATTVVGSPHWADCVGRMISNRIREHISLDDIPMIRARIRQALYPAEEG